MKSLFNRISNFVKWISLLSLITAFAFVTGCKNSPTGPSANTSSDATAMQSIAENDSSITAFDANYNEGQAVSFMGKTAAAITPIKVGQEVRVVSKNFTYNVVNDTSYATFTRTFEGVLYITAVSGLSGQDTVYSKPFTSTITLNLIFVRVGKSNNPSFNWRLAAFSLPEGGTASSNINISNVTVFLANGDTLSIDSPNDYYIDRNVGEKVEAHGMAGMRGFGGMGWWRGFPAIGKNSAVTVKVTLNSAYADTDFVTITHGGDSFGVFHPEKLRLTLVSSTPSGSGYIKVYQGTYVTRNWAGFHHAVVNAFPKQVIFDDSSAVEISTWGIPYFIK